MKSDRTKENIIQQTIALIQEANGAVEDITIRGIAQRAGVGVGLINHYFHSKDRLIEVCVQTIIGGVIRSFRPEILGSKSPVEITTTVAKQVMDFLMDNREISRVSILGDMKQPAAGDNTMKTVAGFAARLSGGQMSQEHRLHAFMITAVLQCVFLRRETLKELGVDFYNKQQRDSFIDDLVERFG